ncbi:hypothetical protein TcG_00309 [Trypanosoma cruzi]|nr:hypothetical protein TcG_00309 [Trypanosoma cruzi]
MRIRLRSRLGGNNGQNIAHKFFPVEKINGLLHSRCVLKEDNGVTATTHSHTHNLPSSAKKRPGVVHRTLAPVLHVQAVVIGGIRALLCVPHSWLGRSRSSLGSRGSSFGCGGLGSALLLRLRRGSLGGRLRSGLGGRLGCRLVGRLGGHASLILLLEVRGQSAVFIRDDEELLLKVQNGIYKEGRTCSFGKAEGWKR